MRRVGLPFAFAVCVAFLMATHSLDGQAPTTNSASAPQPPGGAPGRPGNSAANFTLTTNAFPDGGEIPAKYASTSPAVSPDLEWSNVPDGTVSFVLIFNDPDAALHKSFDDYLHWLVFNIPADTRQLPEGVPPTPTLSDGSIQIKPRANFGGRMGSIAGYLGPGAPPGPFHHYTFSLYALDIKLDLGPDATRADVLKAMDGHILGKAMLIGRFHR